MSRVNKAQMRQWEDDIAKYRQAIEFDANNASAHAMLAETYLQAGQREAAIHEFRTAIGLSPHGPHTAKWKSRLRTTLETEAGVNRFDFTVCHHCEADMPTGTKRCTRCGTPLRMNFFEWLAQPAVYKDVGRQTAIVTSIVIILLTVFSSLSLEWKACVLCATVIVGAYYFLRGVGGTPL
jgi:ribosomal protein L40E